MFVKRNYETKTMKNFKGIRIKNVLARSWTLGNRDERRKIKPF